MPLDMLLPQFDGRLDYIKIDVEGAEPLVLSGAHQTIANNPHIRIVMEWAPNQIRAAGFDIAQFIRKLDQHGTSRLNFGARRIDVHQLGRVIGFTISEWYSFDLYRLVL